MHKPHLTPKETPWYSLLLNAEWTPGQIVICGQIALEEATDLLQDRVHNE
jgi:hypothetical protein